MVSSLNALLLVFCLSWSPLCCACWMSYISSLAGGRKSIWGLSSNTGLTTVNLIAGSTARCCNPLDFHEKLTWLMTNDYVRQLTMGRKDLHHLPVPHANTSERLPLVGVSLQLTTHSAYGLCCVGWTRLTSGHTSPTSGINCFCCCCLERPNQSTPNGMQHNLGWQTCTVTADLCLGHQNVSFGTRAFSPWGWLCPTSACFTYALLT